MDQDNMIQVCNLDSVEDHAFNVMHTQVFGKNLRSFSYNDNFDASQKSDEEIRDVVGRKLDSIYNFKCQYVKFSFRRNVFSCLENAPLSNRINKKQMFSLNFVSINGMRQENNNSSKMQKYVLNQQKKSALEIMAVICSGEFSSVLEIIANQEETIEKIKTEFELLLTFIGKKQNIIEPTLIGISVYNDKMGDWII
jgi:hypothetical protein